MPTLFEVIDPRGKKVICTDEIWYWHVVDGHSEMEDQIEQVKAAIQEPLLGMIFQDRDYPERNIYYKRHSKFIYIKVVVEFLKNGGTLITAYMTDALKPGESLLWTPQSNNS
jgi:hypothetical protein